MGTARRGKSEGGGKYGSYVSDSSHQLTTHHGASTTASFIHRQNTGPLKGVCTVHLSVSVCVSGGHIVAYKEQVCLCTFVGEVKWADAVFVCVCVCILELAST